MLLWTAGDIFKTTYFVINESPTQFLVCGAVQILIDIAILLQVGYYGQDSRSKLGWPRIWTIMMRFTTPKQGHTVLCLMPVAKLCCYFFLCFLVRKMLVLGSINLTWLLHFNGFGIYICKHFFIGNYISIELH